VPSPFVLRMKISTYRMDVRWNVEAAPTRFLPIVTRREDLPVSEMVGPGPHFRAKLSFRDAATGARTTPADLEGYRAELRFPFERSVVFGSVLQPAGKPGKDASVNADITIRSAASILMTRVDRGTRFELLEGRKTVADGRVVSVFRRDD
jgi:translation elongation factor EF-Tu-like GTPase